MVLICFLTLGAGGSIGPGASAVQHFMVIIISIFLTIRHFFSQFNILQHGSELFTLRAQETPLREAPALPKILEQGESDWQDDHFISLWSRMNIVRNLFNCTNTKGLYLKTFYSHNLRIYVISQSVCPWQAFPVQ